MIENDPGTAPSELASPTRTLSLRALLASEIVVGTFINIAFNVVVAWLLFPVGKPIALWGAHGLALDTVPASFVPAVMMTFAVSAILRHRLRGGLHISGGPTPRIPLPENMLARAFAVGLSAIMLVGLPTVAILAMVWNDAWGWAYLVPFKLVFSLFHAAIVTPIVLLTVLHVDRR